MPPPQDAPDPELFDPNPPYEPVENESDIPSVDPDDDDMEVKEI